MQRCCGCEPKVAEEVVEEAAEEAAEETPGPARGVAEGRLHVPRECAARYVEMAGPEEIFADERDLPHDTRAGRMDAQPWVLLEERAARGVREHASERVDAVRVETDEDPLALDGVERLLRVGARAVLSQDST